MKYINNKGDIMSLLDELLKETENTGGHLNILREICDKLYEEQSSKLDNNNPDQKVLKIFWAYLQSFPMMLLALNIGTIDLQKERYLCLEMEGTEDFVICIYERKSQIEQTARRVSTLLIFNDNNAKRIIQKYLSYYKIYIK
jgi:hypothetical protein